MSRAPHPPGHRSRTPPPPQSPEPRLDRLLAIVRERWGLEGSLSPLPGERDLNYRLDEDGGRSWVVKVTSPDEPEAVLAFESALLGWLGRDGGAVPAPRPLPDRGGNVVSRFEGPDGRPLRVRILQHLPGRVLAEARPRADGLLEDVGRTVAGLSRELARFPGEVPARPGFVWAFDQARAAMAAGLGALEEGERRALVREALDRFRTAAPEADALPRQLIHGDANDHNLLVSEPGEGPGRVTGVIDFGDAHRAPAVYDLAIAAAYALLGQVDPLHAMARVVSGWHRVRPLEDREVALVVPFVLARLGASVSISAVRRGGGAGSGALDPYLFVSEAPAWAALAALLEIPPAFAEGTLRRACGLEPCPRAEAMRSWLAAQDPGRVIEPPGGGGVAVLDLSVGSPLLDGRDTDDTPAFTRRVFGAMAEAGATLGVGRWLEPRGFYLTEGFRGRPSEMPERRTVHLGVDVFVEAGTVVRAPLRGRVVAVEEHQERLDYGPAVILEHATPHGPVWTLYGHLERASVADLEVGRELPRGAPFARVGPYPENGDWPPHLHLQVLMDRMGLEGPFPGVCAPREREVWASFCPDPSLLLGPGVSGEYRYRHQEARGLRARRARLLPRNLSLSYADPIHVVRGRGAHLYDEMGREYLDCVNNVAHVGHGHPRVVAAGRRQMTVLNTNTRYLHASIVEYAERLTALFPDPLSVCVFVNSGSEANELALRMARAHTGRRGVVALEGAYHGNTQGLVDVSHYKFAGPGGEGPPPWVRAAAMPDEYRGLYRREDPDRAERYAAHVARALDELASAGYPPAAFLSESVLSCGGQVVLPDAYLERAYRHARAAGAATIADEVQVGFGRVGTHRWGFETQGALPDIVTLGKPIGNGHPLGAVVTTEEIASSFARGLEYFNTFGGNQVSCEIGLAVLDVLEEEGLQAHAEAVGGDLLRRLRGLQAGHPVVGDVRGLGLFLGIELVRGPETDPVPAPEVASYVVARMKERGILLSTDGPDRNVVKIKPPLPFSAEDGARLVEALTSVLEEDAIARPSGDRYATNSSPAP